MSEEKDSNTNVSAIRIMHELGQISGKLEVMDKNMTSRMDMMRDDMLRAYQGMPEPLLTCVKRSKR